MAGTVANVYLWGDRVGAVTWDVNRGIANFEYDPDFVAKGIEVSPLKMPLASGRIYSFPELRDSNTFRGLPGLIADSLPEKFGNSLLKLEFARRGLSFDNVTPVARLCYLGERGMGALEFRPDNDKKKFSSESLELDALVSVAKMVMEDHRSIQDKGSFADGLDKLIQIGTSAGGAKAKAVIAWNRETNDIRSGLEAAPDGYKYYLLKFAGVSNTEHESDEYIGRVELAYHYMALIAKINMTPCQLLESKDGAGHFMTERFDRGPGGTKFHVQTFCAIAHEDRDPVGESSYEALFSTARQLGVGQKDITELFRRMVFNIITRNQDDHTKNHAFIMDSLGNWRVTPAYDLCFAYKAGSRFIDTHQLQCNGKRDDFTLEDIENAAASANVRNYRTIVKDVNRAVDAWVEIAELEQVKLPKKVALGIQQHFRTNLNY